MKKILIIEDELIHSNMYKKMLLNHGYEVDVAQDGEEGLKKALVNHPNLILLDIQMPKLDGITVMKKIREDDWGKYVKIIILTNYDTNEEKLTAITKDQPAYYLVKANNKPEEVLEKVNEILSPITEE